jgi:hypothetical protein
MAALTAPQITEVNAIIAEIEKVIKPKNEIGARDKVTLSSLLKSGQAKKVPQFFKCRREYSDAIVTFFVKEKGIAKSRFHMKNQEAVFILK